MKARLISVLLVLALLVTVGVVAAQAAALTTTVDGTDFNTKSAAAFTQTDFNGKTTETVTARCEACDDDNVEWKPLEQIDAATDSSGHYYVPQGGLSNQSYYNVKSGATLHVHLNGQTITSASHAFVVAKATGAKLAIMGDGVVDSTHSTNATIYTLGQCYLMGGTYKHTGSAETPTLANYKDTNYANYTKRTWISENVTIQGIADMSSGHGGSTSGDYGAAVYVYGGKFDTFIGPAASYSGTTRRAIFTISGTPEIGTLDLSGSYFPTWELSSGASIGLHDSFTGLVIKAADTEDELTTFKSYFHAANTATHEVVIAKASTGRYYVTLKVKAGVAECAACGELAQIIEVAEAPADTALAAGHYKLTADLTLTAPLTVAEDVCIDLGEYNVTNTTGRVLEITSGTVNIGGTGTVTGAAAEGNGATILVSGGTLNLNGGTIKHTGELPTVYVAGTMTMAEGAELTSDEGVTGGNLYIADAGAFTMNGGSITNGTAALGGNIYNDKGTLRINAGSISGGHATTGGGNIYIEKGSSKTIIGDSANQGAVTISGGVSDKSGGNIYTEADVDLTYGAVVKDGEAGTTGGNITILNGTFRHMNSAVIQNGTAGTHGGNVFISEIDDDDDKTVSEMRVSGPSSLIGGKATGTSSTGGNIRVSGGTVNFVSANVTGGTATVSGGMIYISGGRVNLIDGTFDATTASANDCDGIYLRNGTLNLAGGTINADSSDVTNNRGDAIYVGATGSTNTKVIFGEQVKTWAVKTFTIVDSNMDQAFTWNGFDVHSIEVNSAFKGNAYVRLATNNVSSPYYGETVLRGTYTEGATNGGGHIYLARGDQPEILPDGNGGLVVAGALKDGAWTTTADAFATATESIKLYETGAEVTLPENFAAAIDLNGKDITINGSGVVTATNSDATAASAVTLGEGVSLANTEFATWNTDHFDVVLGADSAYTIHRLEMRIKSISLRPTTAGLYYTSEIVMDDVLKEQVDEIGVVLAVGDGSVDLSDPASENVKFVGTNEFDSTVNSVLVNGILKEGEDNASRAQWKIQGAAAVIFKNDDYAVATAENFARSCSMTDFMDMAYEKYAEAEDTDATKIALSDFYDKWYESAGWDYPKFAKAEANA